MTEEFTHESLDPIAAHRVSCCLDTDCEPDPCMTALVQPRDDEEQRIGLTLAPGVDDVELRLVGEALRAQEAARRR
jgi:hypothetical protein